IWRPSVAFYEAGKDRRDTQNRQGRRADRRPVLHVWHWKSAAGVRFQRLLLRLYERFAKGTENRVTRAAEPVGYRSGPRGKHLTRRRMRHESLCRDSRNLPGTPTIHVRAIPRAAGSGPWRRRVGSLPRWADRW